MITVIKKKKDVIKSQLSHSTLFPLERVNTQNETRPIPTCMPGIARKSFHHRIEQHARAELNSVAYQLDQNCDRHDHTPPPALGIIMPPESDSLASVRRGERLLLGPVLLGSLHQILVILNATQTTLEYQLLGEPSPHHFRRNIHAAPATLHRRLPRTLLLPLPPPLLPPATTFLRHLPFDRPFHQRFDLSIFAFSVLQGFARSSLASRALSILRGETRARFKRFALFSAPSFDNSPQPSG